MPYNTTTVLDQITVGQSGKETTANNLFAAMSACAIYGIKASATSGLSLTLYGGNIYVSGVPTAVATQTVTLTASATNYVYATSAGVVTVATSAPAGWPNISSPAGAVALYQLVTNASAIVSGTNFIVGLGQKGDTGVQGAQGPQGTELAASRKRIWTTAGSGSTTQTYIGFEGATVSGGSATARTVATTSLRESIPYTAYVTSAVAGNSVQVQQPRDLFYLGNATGRGGFTVAFRFCMESASSPANQRSFVGLLPVQTIGNVEPDTLTNMFGILAKAGDANFSACCNDSSGTATLTALGSGFPARATDNVYELLLSSTSFTSIISYTLTNLNTGGVASGTWSANIPSNTTYFTPCVWTNNGVTASAAAIGIMQIIGESRY